MFNWQSFLDQHRIAYRDRGRNLSRGNLALKCPFCGDADHGEHMNVSTQGRGWACWRNAEHRGRNPTRLVQALLNCAWAEANEITGGEVTPTDDVMTLNLARLQGSKPAKRGIKLPSGLHPLATSSSSIGYELVLNYLIGRGYSHHDALHLAKQRGMLYANAGAWRKRLIWPLYDERGALLNLTGRAIGTVPPRYKTLPHEEAGAPISECLFDAPRLFHIREGNVLIVCEGPMDAERMTWIGEPFGIYATCVFTQNVSEAQAAMVQRLSYKFDRTVVLFDNGATLHAFRAQQAIGGAAEVASLPAGVKDPDKLAPQQALNLARALLG